MHVLNAVIAAASATGESTGDFFTGQSLGTFAGASAAVVIVGNTLRKVTGKDLLALILVIAVAFAYVAAEITGRPDSVADFALVLLNGCLLFCTALGVNETLVSATSPRPEGRPEAHAKRPIGWLDSWVQPAQARA